MQIFLMRYKTKLKHVIISTTLFMKQILYFILCVCELYLIKNAIAEMLTESF